MIHTTVSSIHVLSCITVLASDTSFISVPHHNAVLPTSYLYTKLITYIRWLWTNTPRDVDDLNSLLHRFQVVFLTFCSILSFLSFVHCWITMRTLFHYARRGGHAYPFHFSPVAICTPTY